MDKTTAKENKMAKTTVQMSKEAREKLQALAEAYKRSSSGQLEWMVDQEFVKLQQVKQMVADVLPKIEARKAKKAAAAEQSVVA
jgi:predicted transcriptional regulator